MGSSALPFQHPVERVQVGARVLAWKKFHRTFTEKSRILFGKLLNKPGTNRIPSPIRWQAANARPAVAATVAMESADAPLAVASKPILPNLDLDARCLLANQASASC